jgi:hypothetical protein
MLYALDERLQYRKTVFNRKKHEIFFSSLNAFIPDRMLLTHQDALTR